MSAVLESWEVAKISEFAKTTSGGTPSRKNPEFYTGDIPWIKSGDLNDGNVSEATEFITEEALNSSSAKMFPAGTLMIALYGATIGKLGVLTIEAATNQAVCGIFVPDEVETKYLFYFLLHHRRELIKQGAGGAQPNISQKIIRDIEVPLPPLPEQRRIVARIEELFPRLDAGVAALRHAKAQLQRYRQSVLAAAITGQLTQAWREQHPDTEPAEELVKRVLEKREREWDGRGKYKPPHEIDGEIPFDAPPSWSWVSSEAICASVRDGTHDTPKYVDEGVPLITSKNLLPSGLSFAKTKNISQADHLEISKRSGVADGDLLFAMIGTIGNPVVVRTSAEFSIKNVGLFKSNEPLISSDYLRIWLSSPNLMRWLEPKQKGTTQKFVPLGLLRSLATPIPPLAEQHQIVAEVEARTTAIDHLEAELDRQITRSNRLRQSTLAAAFSGNLTQPIQ